MKIIRTACLAFLVACIMPQVSLAQNTATDMLNLNLAERMLHRRAVDAVIWSMPIVNFQAMRDGLKNDGGLATNAVGYHSKVQNWKLQTTTNNNTTPYVFIFWNVKNGPVVIDIPPTGDGVGLFGTLMGAWQRPLQDIGDNGFDAGRGAKYLILPPNYQGAYPPGYVSLKQKTYNGYTLIRPIISDTSDANLEKAENHVKQIKVYPLAQAANPPMTRYIDLYDKDIDGVAHFDASYFERIDRMIQEENLEQRDMAFLGLLKSIGIEKGARFNPSDRHQEIFADAAREAHEYMIENYLDRVTPPFYPDSEWYSAVPVNGVPTGFDWDMPNYLDYDGRGSGYFAFYTSVKNLGAASFYLKTSRDSAGQRFNGSNDYKLIVPRDVPVRDFWSVIAYRAEDATWFDDQPHAGIASSDEGVQVNDDGTIDVYFSPEPPLGKEANWVPTTSGEEYFLYFRTYGPKDELFTKEWRLNDMVRQ